MIRQVGLSRMLWVVKNDLWARSRKPCATRPKSSSSTIRVCRRVDHRKTVHDQNRAAWVLPEALDFRSVVSSSKAMSRTCGYVRNAGKGDSSLPDGAKYADWPRRPSAQRDPRRRWGWRWQHAHHGGMRCTLQQRGRTGRGDRRLPRKRRLVRVEQTGTGSGRGRDISKWRSTSTADHRADPRDARPGAPDDRATSAARASCNTPTRT